MTGRPFAASPVAATGRLTARTVRLDAPLDLLAFAGDDGLLVEREGVGLAARGEALRLRLPAGLGADGAAEQVAAALRAIDTTDDVGRPGCGPVAIGALPFDSHEPAELVVPETVVGRAADGTSWLTTVAPAGVDRAPLAALPHLDGRRPAQAPDAFSLTPTLAHTDWCRRVEDALAEIAAGRLRKVVLAREVVVEANRPIVVHEVLGRLRALYPSCTVFSVGGFVGASPEVLVTRRGSEVSSHPLAGTVPRSGDPEVDARVAAALLESAKDRAEHGAVVEAVAGALAPLCETLDVPAAPSIVPLRNVSHLGTRLRGRLRDPAPSALALAARLHPTPAVAGTPAAGALDHLRAAEGFPRGRYAGPVGWMDRHGDGLFVVGIRSAEIDGNRARLFAGVGIVDGSVPDDELVETQLKLQALLAAVVRP